MVMKKNVYRVEDFKPLHKNVFVTDLDHGERTLKSGIILADDNMKESGIRERWGRVWAVGPEVDDLEAGQWVLIQRQRWTEGMQFDTDEGMITVWMVEYPDSVLLVSDEDPR